MKSNYERQALLKLLGDTLGELEDSILAALASEILLTKVTFKGTYDGVPEFEVKEFNNGASS